MSERILLGVLTPSSNTVVEPVTSEIVRELRGVSAHFSRFGVTQISLSDRATGQFELEKILSAARLLADARVDVIAWSGTASGWLGFDTDERLCEEIQRATGIPATTSVLALNEILAKTGADRLGLVSPYTADVQSRIVQNYERIGVRCVAECHAELDVNFSFSEVSEGQITDMVRQVTWQKPSAVAIFCTNLKAAHLAARLEAETGTPIYDSVACAVWKCLRMTDVDTRALTGWGRLFQEVF